MYLNYDGDCIEVDVFLVKFTAFLSSDFVLDAFCMLVRGTYIKFGGVRSEIEVSRNIRQKRGLLGI